MIDVFEKTPFCCPEKQEKKRTQMVGQTYCLHAGRLFTKTTEITKTMKTTKTTQTATNKESRAELTEITETTEITKTTGIRRFRSANHGFHEQRVLKYPK